MVHRTVRLATLKALTLHSQRREKFIHAYIRQGGFLYTYSLARARSSLAHTRGTGHTHLISRFLFFHLPSSSFFGARRCNHVCLPLSIHHPPILDVILFACSSLLLLIMHHLSFALSSRGTTRDAERNSYVVIPIPILLDFSLNPTKR